MKLAFLEITTSESKGKSCTIGSGSPRNLQGLEVWHETGVKGEDEMDTNYFLGRLNSQLNYLSGGVFEMMKADNMMRESAKKALTTQFSGLQAFNEQLHNLTNLFFKEFPDESITREREMEDWWDHIAEGWSPDKLTNGKK
jgi:hypothetical protein